MSMALTPVWSAIADRMIDGKRKVLLLSVMCSTIFFMLYSFAECQLIPTQHTFGYLLVVRLIFSAFFCCALSLMDAYMLDYLEGDHEAYGKERMWGAIAWGSTHLVLGFFIQLAGTVSLYPLGFLTSGVFLAALYNTLGPLEHGDIRLETRVGSELLENGTDMNKYGHVSRPVSLEKTASLGSTIDTNAESGLCFPPAGKNSPGNIEKRGSASTAPLGSIPEDSDNIVDLHEQNQMIPPRTSFSKRSSTVSRESSGSLEGSEEKGGLILGSEYPLDLEGDEKEDYIPTIKRALGGGPNKGERHWKEVLSLLCLNSETVGFFFANFATGAGMSLVENLFFLFYKNEVGASAVLCGISVVITVIVELPIFASGRYLLRRVGIMPLMLISQLAYSSRAIGYTLIPDPALILALEPLHGVTYGTMQIASVDYMATIAPKGLEASAQGLLAAFNRGLGFLVGTIVGGFVMQNYGSKIMFTGAAALVAFSGALYAGCWVLTRKCGL
ncbi:hypothetical protein AAMO2058_000083300 [Amorphochlora amoebiformis]